MTRRSIEPTRRTRHAVLACLYGVVAAEQWRLGVLPVATGASFLTELLINAGAPDVVNEDRSRADLGQAIAASARGDDFFGLEIADHFLSWSGLGVAGRTEDLDPPLSDLAPFLAVPLALHWHFHPTRAVELVRRTLPTTHPDADVVDAGVVMAAAIVAACRGDDLLAIARRRTARADMTERLADVANLRNRAVPPRYLMEFFDRSGRAVDSVPIALYVGAVSETVVDACESLEDLGVPDSAVWALAGALVGARGLENALPPTIPSTLPAALRERLRSTAQYLATEPCLDSAAREDASGG